MATKTQLGSIPSSYREQLALGDEHYLWILVVVEVVALFMLRGSFARYHGG